MIGNERVDTAPPKAGAANRRSVGALESAWPQARVIVPGDFALALERHGSEAAVLVLAGELDLYRGAAIEDALAEAIGSKLDEDQPVLGAPGEDAQRLDETVHNLTVDLRLVTFIGSPTPDLLLAASRRQHAQGGQLLVLVGPQTPMTAFEVTGLDRLLAIRRLTDEPEHEPYAASSGGIGLDPPPNNPRGRNHHDNSGNN